MSEHADEIKKLHTRLIDSHDGLKSAFEEADSHPKASEFRTLADQRGSFAERIRGQASSEGMELDEDGSMLAAMHRALISLRDALSTGDEAVVSEVVRGEEALLELYDAAIAATQDQPAWSFLSGQRAEIASGLAALKADTASA